MVRIRVLLVNRGVDGISMCFIVSDINTGVKYTIGNCHRSDHPLWKMKNIQCFCGNVEFENGYYRRAYLHFYRNGKMLLIM